ncbi:hypothetical protein DAPPUDRAFT_315433 [Daphnia pulex]|uniref:Uncharacterized protein n=1 Tax=Daphnia pulex TaxID=6669 RepID=E9G9R2_DAPPU|nr:hypothetical protein DAPPUDRAFT_315433 [Daphnia pulex]|eukprot:EFX83840.1 hypothetical protein DAPPUDRAFT_315433 [Daphnia pulex]
METSGNFECLAQVRKAPLLIFSVCLDCFLKKLRIKYTLLIALLHLELPTTPTEPVSNLRKTYNVKLPRISLPVVCGNRFS